MSKETNIREQIEREQTFDEYISAARDLFVIAVKEQKWNTELRVEAENILIAYDQLRSKLSEANKKIEQLEKEYQGLDASYFALREENENMKCLPSDSEILKIAKIEIPEDLYCDCGGMVTIEDKNEKRRNILIKGIKIGLNFRQPNKTR